MRNTIHTNLMCTYILSDFTWILTSTLQVCEQFNLLNEILSVVFLIFIKLFKIYNLTNKKCLTIDRIYSIPNNHTIRRNAFVNCNIINQTVNSLVYPTLNELLHLLLYFEQIHIQLNVYKTTY